MRKLVLYVLFVLLVTPSCSQKTAGTTPVVKPKYHNSWFNKKKDKKKKRTKVVRMRN